MQIKEITQLSTRTLTETIKQNNATGYLTEDLVKVVREHKNDAWSEAMTADELLAEMDSWE